jgi:CheY-like chemotaxis protein
MPNISRMFMPESSEAGVGNEQRTRIQNPWKQTETYDREGRYIKRWVPELVISDIGLAGGSGYDLMRALQSLSAVKGIALSGYGMKSDIDRSIAAGFSAHLTKPRDFSTLNAAIEKVLS